MHHLVSSSHLVEWFRKTRFDGTLYSKERPQRSVSKALSEAALCHVKHALNTNSSELNESVMYKLHYSYSGVI